jgi:hypothetical protein
MMLRKREKWKEICGKMMQKKTVERLSESLLESRNGKTTSVTVLFNPKDDLVGSVAKVEVKFEF